MTSSRGATLLPWCELPSHHLPEMDSQELRPQRFGEHVRGLVGGVDGCHSDGSAIDMIAEMVVFGVQVSCPRAHLR